MEEKRKISRYYEFKRHENALLWDYFVYVCLVCCVCERRTLQSLDLNLEFPCARKWSANSGVWHGTAPLTQYHIHYMWSPVRLNKQTEANWYYYMAYLFACMRVAHFHYFIRIYFYMWQAVRSRHTFILLKQTRKKDFVRWVCCGWQKQSESFSDLIAKPIRPSFLALWRTK